MQVEIWSDMVCPFCYIGKRKFEQALEKFPHKDLVEITWKSFQLDPDAPKEGGDYYKTLSERKGWTLEQTRQITDNVRTMASEVGLEYHFEKAISANSFDAHRLSHLAQQKGLQNEAEEAIFRAHFIEGQNIADQATLIRIGEKIGLPKAEVEALFQNEAYSKEVLADVDEARQLGVNGVPFFVFDRKYAVSGAQASEVFLKTLEQVFALQGK